MEQINTLLNKALILREIEGNPRGAIKLYEDALLLTSDPVTEAGVMSQLALCFQHLGEFEKAKKLYSSAYTTFHIHNDVVSKARIALQLSAIALKENDVQMGLYHAFSARNMVLVYGVKPNDMCQLTHGYIKALYALRKQDGRRMWYKSTVTIYGWLQIEYREVKNMLKVEKSLAREVWLTGFLIDMFLLFPLITWPFGLAAIIISFQKNLGMRKKQFLSVLFKKNPSL